ncbi:hypothetical protein X777_08696 [Ooceraea biroi]|uniref:Uncharacterized protein n=1 Tax=Ooceraea biroi TaxID=2015173 RepID=A0A026W895_OOCBI|nr:hypothetical protein X777_08696 [Ooceraea biroi]
MNSFENLGGDPSKLRARQGSKNLAWRCLRDGKGGGSTRLRMKLQASSAEELDEDEDNDEEKGKGRRKGGRGREYKMRVFGEKDIGEGWRGISGKG